ncbi:hypothetical protein RBU49_00940 [Clostridium sp. MB40-C1]|uniref:hypothetical protein n=1 Tax=Clostridium sp. MB40-C1 TaxID=3070996 RepID=UPI0027E0045C|nr:hypothetical protein [Clostridium sp. MB40-C1]WMJ80844.1 hypothetical protein RBU49_00940 [Clostridium sp. MB40-C1]
MKNKFKVKKGFSLVMVLGVLSILSILGCAILSLAMSSYKMRTMNGNLKTNLYASEAGIDKAYGIIGKVVDGAINNGNEEVKKAQEKLKKIIEKERLKLLSDKNYESPYFNRDGSINEEEIKKFENNIFQTNYKQYIENNICKELTNNDNYEFDENGDKEKFNSEGTKPKISFSTEDNDEREWKFSQDNKLKVGITSTFLHKKLERKVACEYELSVPEYKSVYYIENKVVKFPENLAFLKGLAVDGDMIVESANVEVDGNIFVKGRNVARTGDIIDKSNTESGIIIKGNNSKVSILGDVSSAQNILLKGENNKIEINGDAYARNAIVGSEGTKCSMHLKKKSNLAGSLYTMDDLELNGEKSHINIEGGFYGVSDGKDSKESNQSSSIIINSEDIGRGSGINIQSKGKEDEVLIAGSSYIKLYNEEYQTGESVSIKGNYKAYTNPLISGNPVTHKDGKSLIGDNVEFEYKEPLTLVTKFADGVDMNVFDKSDYFKAYSEDEAYNNEEDYKLSLGGEGIKINKINFNTGAVLSNSLGNKVEGSNYSLGKYSEIIDKANELKRNIFYMGDLSIDKEYVNNTIKVAKKVSDKVDFNKITNTIKGKNADGSVDYNSNFILLNNNPNKSYVFYCEGDKDIPIGEDKELIKINKNKGNGEFGGIIITNGDVCFCGKLKFKGSIICEGDIKFQGNSFKEINYDEDYVKKLIAYNYLDFEGVFNDNIRDKFFEVETDITVNLDENTKTDVIREKLIKRKSWKILK